MDLAVAVLCGINFLIIGLLPKIFFKKDGSFNLMWWITAAPFLLCLSSLTISYLGYWTPITGYGTTLTAACGLLSIPFSVGSLMLMAFTLGTHRIPIALWHQNNDKPKHVVTYGAYGKIRHPFYSSFLLAFTSALIYCPHAGTLFALIAGAVILTLTAMKEEKKFLASDFSEEYRQYMKITGRFFPKGFKYG